MDVEIRSRLIVGWPEVVKPTSGFGRQPQGFVVHDGAARPEPTLPRLTRSETAPRRPEVRNIGDAKIRQGTQVVWQIRETGEHGSFFVPLDLLAGRRSAGSRSSCGRYPQDQSLLLEHRLN